MRDQKLPTKGQNLQIMIKTKHITFEFFEALEILENSLNQYKAAWLNGIKRIKGETRKALAAAPGFEERHCEPNPFHL